MKDRRTCLGTPMMNVETATSQAAGFHSKREPRRAPTIQAWCSALLASASTLASAPPVAATAAPTTTDQESTRISDGTPTEHERPDVEPTAIGDPTTEAELADLATIASQRGISLSEAVATYAWHDDFASTVGGIRTAEPSALAHAAITGPRSAEVWFTSDVPVAAGTSIDAFRSFFPAVSVTIRSGYGLSEHSADAALVAVHKAVLAQVSDATSSFDHEGRRISVLVADDRPLDSVDLEAIAS